MRCKCAGGARVKPAPRALASCANAGVAGAPWLYVCRSTDVPRYAVTDIAYLDEQHSGGNVNIYVSVLDELGRPAFGTRVYFNTLDGQNPATQTVINGSTDFPQSGDSSFDPGRGESGPYFVEIADRESRDPQRDAASDRVQGMGLPLRRHVVYQIRFQRVVSAAPTTTPPPASTWTPAPGPTATVMPGGKCDVLPISGVKICAP